MLTLNRCLAGLTLAAFILPAVGRAADAPVPSGRPNDELLTKLSSNDLRFQDYEQAVLVLGLKDAAEKSFRERIKTRNEKMEVLDKTDDAKKLAALREQLKDAKDDAKTEDLKKQMKPLEEGYDVKRSAARAELLTSLSPDQQRYWVQWVLFRELNAKCRSLTLTSEQKDKLWAACAEPAQKLVQADALKTDPYLRKITDTREALTKTLTNDILTKDQRESLPKPGEKPAPKKSEGKKAPAKKAEAKKTETNASEKKPARSGNLD